MAIQTNRVDEHNRRLALALDILTSAALNGLPCPSNYDLCAALDLSSPGNAADLISKLERQGDISVRRFSAGRIVTIIATGRSTKGMVGNRHWSERGPLRRATAAPVVKERGAGNIRDGFRGEPPAHLYVSRDPCPRCGIRRDVGCAHTASRLLSA